MNYLQQVQIDCPWCGEVFDSTVDTSQGSHEHIEDCAVCCRPIAVAVECEPGELFSVQSGRP